MPASLHRLRQTHRIVVGWVASVALAAVPGVAHARVANLTCFATVAGETASQSARRLTGSAAHARSLWFQIYDPAAARFGPKDEYGRLPPGWRACVLAARAGPADALAPTRPVLSPGPRADSWIHHVAARPETWWGLALVVGVLAIWETLAVRRTPARLALAATMTDFGRRFVREFERPLFRAGADAPAVASRLRPLPARRYLDILLAPRGQWRYPNLSDHRANVEYDIGRVMQLLNDDRFVAERLFSQGRWVVLRCFVRGNRATGGGT